MWRDARLPPPRWLQPQPEDAQDQQVTSRRSARTREPWVTNTLESCGETLDCLPPREVLQGFIVVLLVLAVLLWTFCGMPEDAIDDLNHWAEQPWQRVDDCKVNTSGIAYLGDCVVETYATIKLVHPRPKFNFSACAGMEEEPASCRKAVGEAFSKGRRLQADTVAAHAPPAEPRRLKQHVDELCRDTFAVWAAVEVEGNDVCGYPTGLLSKSSDARWQRALEQYQELTPGTSRPCWLLTLVGAGLLSMHDCHIVALEDPRLWPKARDKWLASEMSTRRKRFWTGIFLAVVGFLACWVLHGAKSSQIERWEDLSNCLDTFGCQPCSTVERPPQTESERVRFVRDRWQRFRANMLSDFEALHSAREYMRVPAHSPCSPGDDFETLDPPD